MAETGFDYAGFYAALDAERRNRSKTWRQVARDTGVSPSSLTRMAQGSRPDLDTVAVLSAWADLDASAFFGSKASSASLSVLTSYIHQDPALTPEAADALERVVRVTYSQLAGRADTGHGRTS